MMKKFILILLHLNPKDFSQRMEKLTLMCETLRILLSALDEGGVTDHCFDNYVHFVAL